MNWFCWCGTVWGKKEYKWANTFWTPSMWQADLQCYLILSVGSCSLQRWRTGDSGHRQLVKGHVASMRHRTPGPSAVQHLYCLSIAPIKGRSKGTFTFGEGTDLGLRRCGLYWFVCLLKQLLLQSDSLDYFRAAMSFKSPLESLEECAKKKKTQESIIGTHPQFAIMTSICKEVFIPL